MTFATGLVVGIFIGIFLALLGMFIGFTAKDDLPLSAQKRKAWGKEGRETKH